MSAKDIINDLLRKGEKTVLKERYELQIVELSFGGMKRGNMNEENPHENIADIDLVIIEAIKANPLITHSELAEKIKRHRDTVRVHLKSLREKGLVRRVGPAKGGCWEIIDKNI